MLSPDKPKKIALIDVDATLVDTDPATHRDDVNYPLIEALKQSGLTDIMLFTTMTYHQIGQSAANEAIMSRYELVEYLKKEGINVIDSVVLSKNDPAYNQGSGDYYRNEMYPQYEKLVKNKSHNQSPEYAFFQASDNIHSFFTETLLSTLNDRWMRTPVDFSRDKQLLDKTIEDLINASKSLPENEQQQIEAQIKHAENLYDDLHVLAKKIQAHQQALNNDSSLDKEALRQEIIQFIHENQSLSKYEWFQQLGTQFYPDTDKAHMLAFGAQKVQDLGYTDVIVFDDKPGVLEASAVASSQFNFSVTTCLVDMKSGDQDTTYYMTATKTLDYIASFDSLDSDELYGRFQGFKTNLVEHEKFMGQRTQELDTRYDDINKELSEINKIQNENKDRSRIRDIPGELESLKKPGTFAKKSTKQEYKTNRTNLLQELQDAHGRMAKRKELKAEQKSIRPAKDAMKAKHQELYCMASQASKILKQRNYSPAPKRKMQRRKPRRFNQSELVSLKKSETAANHQWKSAKTHSATQLSDAYKVFQSQRHQHRAAFNQAIQDIGVATSHEAIDAIIEKMESSFDSMRASHATLQQAYDGCDERARLKLPAEMDKSLTEIFKNGRAENQLENQHQLMLTAAKTVKQSLQADSPGLGKGSN